MIVLLALALASEPIETPARPERPADQEGDCSHKAGAPAESSRTCAAVSVPPSDLAYLETMHVYAGQLELHLVGALAVHAADAGACADAVAWRDAEIARLQAPTPFLQRPGTQVALGVIGGAALTVSAGWALGQVAP